MGLYRSATFQGLPNGLKSSVHAGQSLGIRACLLPQPRTDLQQAPYLEPHYICPRVKGSSEIQSSLYLSQQQLRTGKEPERCAYHPTHSIHLPYREVSSSQTTPQRVPRFKPFSDLSFQEPSAPKMMLSLISNALGQACRWKLLATSLYSRRQCPELGVCLLL